MTCCTPFVKKVAVFSTAAFCLVLGIILAVCWTMIFNTIFKHEISLSSKNTMAYDKWQKTPIPMYIEFYLFDWVNHEEVQKDNKIKPKFEERGPYTFSEMHIRENVTFNDNNDTITFWTKRIWHFLPEKSKGTLQDNITNINVIAATVAYFVRDQHSYIKWFVDFFMKEKKANLVITKTVGELLFDGYEDELLNLAHKLNISGLNVPFTKFGWFSERNGSNTYDGVFTMYNGADDLRKLGRLSKWNYSPNTGVYPGKCGVVEGTTGEEWYPIEEDKEVTIFSNDVCSTINLAKEGQMTRYGLDGYKFTANESMFDNGTHYPDMKCFVTGKLENNNLPSGIRNVSKCKFNAPAFVSYPHFYLADPYYRNAVDGMKPNQSRHEFYIGLEPKTGIPLEVGASIQINILMLQQKDISIFKNVNTTLLPTLWFRQSAYLTSDLADQTKFLLVLPSVGRYTGYGIIGIGFLLAIIGVYITVKGGWKGSSDQQQLLSQEAL